MGYRALAPHEQANTVPKAVAKAPQLGYTAVSLPPLQAACPDISGHVRTMQIMGTANNPQTSNQRLGSWKEIAVFFGCDERTLRRWEKERGLPVHRLPGGSGGRVFAYTEELSAWLAAPRNASASVQRPDAAAQPEPHAATTLLTSIDGGRATGRPVLAPPSIGRRWKTARAAVAAIFGLGVLSLALLYRAPAPGTSGARAAGKATPAIRQDSRGGVVLASSVSHDPEAEQFYLKGRYYWNKRTADGLNQAVDYFTQAIVHDPNYALAYVGLADCYNLLREYTMMPSAEAYSRSFAAAKKAVELDDQSSAAHASLAFVLFYGRWDIAGAETEFRRAIDLDPRNAVAHHWYATYLMTLRRLPESLEEIEVAETLDPASTSILADKGAILFHAGRQEEAVGLLKQMEATEPSFRSPHLYLKVFYLARGQYPEFLAESRKDALLVHDNTALAITAAAEKGFAAGGPTQMLANMLAVERAYYAQHMLSPFVVAQTCALLGNKKAAINYLQAAYDQHDELFLSVEDYPALQSLHDEQRFRDLVTRLNFPVDN